MIEVKREFMSARKFRESDDEAFFLLWVFFNRDKMKSFSENYNFIFRNIFFIIH